MPRNTPKANIVCWTPCGQPGAIIMGADPDPNIRAYLLKQASPELIPEEGSPPGFGIT